MKLEYKDGKIYITADSAEQLTKAHKVSEGITKKAIGAKITRYG